MQSGQVFNVMDYGAKADGVTDDVAAIQAAINAAAAAGGGTIYMPAGTYKLTKMPFGYPTGTWQNGSNLELKSNCHLKGDGIGNTVLTAGTDYANCLGAYYQRDVEISHLTLQDNGYWADSIKLMSCSGVYIHDVEVKDSDYSGMNILTCNDVLIADCVVHDNAVFGIACQETTTGDYPTPDGTYAQDITIRDCEAYNNTYGFQSQGLQDGSRNIVNMTWARLYAHDNDNADNWGKNLWARYTTNIVMSDCRAHRSATTSYNVFAEHCLGGSIANTGYINPGLTYAVLQGNSPAVSESGSYVDQ